MPDSDVRKNAFLVAEASRSKLPADVYAKALDDAEPRVRLAALRAMGAAPLEASAGALLLSAQARMTDDWSKAAATAAAAANPGPVLAGILSGPADAAGADFARTLAASLSGDDATTVLTAAAKSANKPVAIAVIREIAARRVAAPASLDAPRAALRTLIADQDSAISGSAAAIAALWFTDGSLKTELAAVADRLLPLLGDAKVSIEAQVAAARVIVLLRDANPQVRPALTQALAGSNEAVAVATAGALAASGDASVGKLLYAAFPSRPVPTAPLCFPRWSAVPSGLVWCSTPWKPSRSPRCSSDRCRSLSSSAIRTKLSPSARAAVLLKLNAGSSPAKDDIVSKLRAEVEKPGDAVKGKELFVAACQTCHKIGNVGNDFGPNLQGIGSHRQLRCLCTSWTRTAWSTTNTAPGISR
ncbi:hypothetical protein EMGBS6_15010 [Opitutia bacterium]|nr:hypothetical protein EMGBS6_15010 [Opitutae bacterium]